MVLCHVIGLYVGYLVRYQACALVMWSSRYSQIGVHRLHAGLGASRSVLTRDLRQGCEVTREFLTSIDTLRELSGQVSSMRIGRTVVEMEVGTRATEWRWVLGRS